MITDEDKERVRQATDIVTLVGETVELRQRGREFWGCCPFHGEKTPSFKVNPDTGLWHCFGCGIGGGRGFGDQHGWFAGNPEPEDTPAIGLTLHLQRAAHA